MRLGTRIRSILKELSRGKMSVLEEAIVSRLEIVEDDTQIDRPHDASLDKYLRLIGTINRTIIKEHSKIDKIFRKRKDERQ